MIFTKFTNIPINMNPVHNPYTPGAGAPPPELAGRQEIISSVNTSFERLKIGRQVKNVLLVGLRGVGKTVLLDKLRLDAEGAGMTTLRIEAPEGKSLPAMLAPEMRKALIKLSRTAKAKDLAQRALRGLASFAKGLKIKFSDIEVGLDFDPEKGLADNGDLELDLIDLMETAGVAAKQADSGIVICIDELQYINQSEMAALITALHRCAQRQLPVMLVGAGLPQLRGLMGEAKSYSERLFDFPEIGPLKLTDAKAAISKPAEEQQVHYTDSALEQIIDHTRGYPYFIQEWGKHSWDVATQSPIDVSVIAEASESALAALDESFFRVRFDRLTPVEKEYLRAMADLGSGPYRSGDIAKRLSKQVTSLAPIRSSLIKKGMIWSPSHGDTAFTVPLFDEFMRRIMPDWRPEKERA